MEASTKATPPRPLVRTTEDRRPVSEYTCPMHPDVRRDHPGNCPKCGMALEPAAPIPSAARTEYVCPMHPEIVRSQPGNCPICGMTLEPRVVSAETEEAPELAYMTRRFWASVVFTVPLLFLAMSEIIPGRPVERAIPMPLRMWIELALATPAVLWAGWPLFVRGWQSISITSHLEIACGYGRARKFRSMVSCSKEAARWMSRWSRVNLSLLKRKQVTV